jgi:hypothetical protein
MSTKMVWVAGLLFSVGAAAGPRYVGTGNTEARVTFTQQVRIEKAAMPTVAEATSALQRQLLFLRSDLRRTATAAPYGDYRAEVLAIEPAEGAWLATYAYDGKFIVRDGLTELSLLLPVTPAQVYATSQGLCSDEALGEGSFWYDWNPALGGCPLREGVDYRRFTATFQRVANTVKTYPEYDRLVGANGEIEVSVAFGAASPPTPMDPSEAGAAGAFDYLTFRGLLTSQGYQGRRWTDEEVQALAGDPSAAYVEEFTKPSARGLIRVRAFYGSSGLYEGSRGFHYFLKDALENRAVFLYGGHAGLGKNLDLRRIQELEGFTLALARDRYQILYLSGCFTYSYYTDQYFLAKRTEQDPAGTRNLEVLSNGVEGLFGYTPATLMSVLSAVEGWAQGTSALTYQELTAKRKLW